MVAPINDPHKLQHEQSWLLRRYFSRSQTITLLRNYVIVSLVNNR